jgi:FlaA1/EpsC-like NDP-sugar epimerase
MVCLQGYATALTAMGRGRKIGVLLVLDALCICLSFAGAMQLWVGGDARLGRNAPWAILLLGVVVALLVFALLGLYRTVLRHATPTILLPIAVGACLAGGAVDLAGQVSQAPLPRMMPLTFAALVLAAVAALRLGGQRLLRASQQPLRRRPVIIYGAGEAGVDLLHALVRGSAYLPVAFVDDDPALQGLSLGGVDIYAPAMIPRLAQDRGAQLVLLAMPSLALAQRCAIARALEARGLAVRTVPELAEILGGGVGIDVLRRISPQDLLGRHPVVPDPALVGLSIAEKVVMVSGAGGSIGSELCRQILMKGPVALVLYEISESALYSIEAELVAQARRMRVQVRVIPVLGSVQNAQRVEAVIAAFGVTTIFHAAAYKHVPLVEENVVEGVRNNVFGTLTIAEAAQKLGVENFVLISTDKAVRPANVMGATKRIAELICQAHAREGAATRFSMVRFGNVVGSSGSVIPLFRAQIESGGPVTVTHRDVTRYFMTIPEASELVLQASALARGGDVFVLDMGPPVRILDLAMEMVRRSGLTPYVTEQAEVAAPAPAQGRMPICITGLRKGEKLFEELLIGNDPRPTAHPQIMTASETALPMAPLRAALARLLEACDHFDLGAIVAILRELPLDYTPGVTEVSDPSRSGAMSGAAVSLAPAAPRLRRQAR